MRAILRKLKDVFKGQNHESSQRNAVADDVVLDVPDLALDCDSVDFYSVDDPGVLCEKATYSSDYESFVPPPARSGFLYKPISFSWVSGLSLIRPNFSLDSVAVTNLQRNESIPFVPQRSAVYHKFNGFMTKQFKKNYLVNSTLNLMKNDYPTSRRSSRSTSVFHFGKLGAGLCSLFLVLGMSGNVFGQFAVTTNGGSGLSASYPSLASAITALNAATITSPVVITCPSGSETAPAGGYNITATGSSTNTITITGAGAANSTVTAYYPQVAGQKYDAIFRIVGGDYITIQGFKMQENASNTVSAVASNTMTEFGVALFLTSSTNGAQYNTIQNNTIVLSTGAAYQNAIGVFSSSASSSTNGALAATTIGGTNSFNKFYGNTISGVAQGFYFISPVQTATIFESGNDIGGSSLSTGNTITYGISNTAGDLAFTSYSGTTPAGVYFRNVVGNSVRFNTITSQTGLTLVSGGIFSANGTAPSGVTYTSNFSDNTITITNASTTAITGIEFGSGLSTGTIVANNNTITLNQNPSAATSAAAKGINAAYASATNTLTGNTVTFNQSTTGTGITSSAFTGIDASGAGTTINILSNTVLVNQTTASTAAVTSAITGIKATTASTTVNIGGLGTGNTVTVKQAVTGSGAYGSGTMYYINAGAGHGTLNITYNNINNSGSNQRSTGTTYGISHNGTITTALNVNNNTINLGMGATAAATLYGIYSGSSTIANIPYNIKDNSITFSGTVGSTYGISNSDGTASSATNKVVTGNTINITGSATTLMGISVGYANGLTVNGNTFNLISSATAPTSLIGLNLGSSLGGVSDVTNNTFTSLGLNGVITGSPVVSGIAVTSGVGSTIYGNYVTNISVGAAGSTATPTVDGILVSGGTNINVYKNKISGITTQATGTTTVVNGIRISGGTNCNFYNNIIGGLTAPASAAVDAIRGISITSATTTSTYKVYNNTIYLNASSTGANFGATGVYHTASATATTAALDLQNNMIINNSVPTGTGIVCALRRSAAATFANYATSSNKNLLFDGTPGAYSLIMYDGTNSYQTLSEYQAAASSRDANSVTESSFDAATYFASVDASTSNYLQPASGLSTQAESGGNTLALTANDYNGIARPASGGTGYDIGAWEFAGVSPAPVFTNLTATPSLTTLCSKSDRTVAIDVTTTAGTITGAVLNFSYNGVAQSPVTMTNSANNTWSGVITAPASASANALVSWSVTATNSIGLSSTYNGTSYSDEPLFGSVTTATATPATVCSGLNTSLKLTSYRAANKDVGAGLTTNATYPNPFYTNWGHSKNQYLIKASELIAAGLGEGNINSLAINITAGTTALTNFSVQMAHTTASDMSVFVSPSFTQVYSNATLTPVVGVNTLSFSTPFYWDGVSNIVIQTCFGNANTSTVSSTVTADNTSYVSVAHWNASTTTTASATCGQTTATNTYSVRPKFTFNGNTLTMTNVSWSDGTNTLGTSNPLSTSLTVLTTYTGTATVANCPVTASVNVDIYPLPSAPTATNSAHCGLNVPTASVTSTTGNANPTFRWYANPTGGTALQSSTSTTYLTAISVSDTFYVSEFNGTCESFPRTAVIVTVSIPPSIIVSPSVTICNGDSTTLTISSENSYIYQWYIGTYSPGSVLATSDVYKVAPSSTTTYNVKAGDINGCILTSSVVVTVNPKPSSVSISPASSTICVGATASLSASGGLVVGTAANKNLGVATTTSTSIAVNPAYGGYGGVKSQYLITASELTALGMTAGRINSIAMDFTVAGSALSGFAINIGTSALTALTSNIETVSNQVYSVASYQPTVGVNTFTFSTPYVWDGTSNIILSFCWSNANTSNTTSTVKYSVAAFVASNARAADSRTVSEICSYTGSTAPTGWTTTTSTSTSRPNFIINWNALTYPSWSWVPGNQTTASVSVTPTVNTTYSATATINGCSSTGTASVAINDLAIVSATPTDILCNGANTGSISVVASGGVAPLSYSLNGTTYASNNVISNVVAGTYTVYVKDAMGCIVTMTGVTINQPTALALNSTLVQPTCYATVGSITYSADGGVAPYTYTLNGTSSVSPATGLSSGSYTIIATDANGCTKSSTVVLNPIVYPSATIVTTPACSGSSNGTAKVVVSNATAPYTYLWSTTATTDSIGSLAAGSYSVTVTDNNGCTANATGIVNQPTILTTIENAPCNGGVGSITATGSNGVAPYTYSLNGSTYSSTNQFTGLVAGSYTVSILDANNCAASSIVSVTQPDVLVANASTSDVLCVGGSVNVQVSATGGTLPYTGTGSFVETTDGQKSYVVTDAKGCTANASLTLTIPTYTITASVTAGGTITPAGATTVICGNSQAYTIHVDSINGALAILDSVIIDGVKQTVAPLSYTFTNVNANHTIAAYLSVAACQNPATANVPANAMICTGNAYTLVGTYGGGATSATWSTNGTGVIDNVLNTYTPSAADIAAGQVSLFYTTNDPDGALTSCNVAVDTTILKFSSVSASSSVSCTSLVPGSTAVLSGSATSSSTITAYSWALNGTAISGASTINYTTAVNAAGTYTLTVTNTNGCSATSSPIVITNLSGPLATGTYYINPTGCGFKSIAGAVSYLNANGIGGNVVFNVPAGYTETAPVGGIKLKMTSLATNLVSGSTQTITFQKSGTGANPKVTAFVGTTLYYDAIISVVGADNVTFDGIDVFESASNTTATTQMEYGYGLFKNDGNNGVNDVVIKNATISLSKLNVPSATQGGSRGIGVMNQNESTTTTFVNSTFTTSVQAARNKVSLTSNTITSYTGIFIGGNASTASTGASMNDTLNNVSNNTINFGGVSPSSTYYSYGIYYTNNRGVTVRNNTFNGLQTGTLGYMAAIYAASGTWAKINKNTITMDGAYYSYGIYHVLTGGSATNPNIVSVDSNNVVNCINRGTGVLYGIYGSSTGGTNALVTSNNNVFSGTTTISSGSVYGFYQLMSGTDMIWNNNNNQVVNNVMSSTNTFYGIYGYATSGNAIWTNNIIRNNTLSPSSGAAYLLYPASTSLTWNVKNNQVVNNKRIALATATSLGSTYGIYWAGSSTNAGEVSGNIVDSLLFTSANTATSSIYGYYVSNTSPGTYFKNNIVRNINVKGVTTGTQTIYGMYLSPSGINQYFNNNKVSNISTESSVNGTVYGVYLGGSTTAGTNKYFFNNTISNIKAGGASGAVRGIQIATGQDCYVYNNAISRLSAPSASPTTAPTATTGLQVYGIDISASTAGYNYYLYNNSIYLTGSGGGANFATSGIHANSTPNVTLVNNLVINNMTPGSAYNSIAYRRSSGTANTIPATYQIASDNNLFYAGTPGTANLIYGEGAATLTNAKQTLVDYKAFMATRDQSSRTEANTPFVNVATDSMLHIAATTATFVEGGGKLYNGLTTDIDGQTRNALTPDIGADEGDFTSTLPQILSFAASPAIGQCSAVNHTVTVTTGSSVTGVTLNYAYNGVAQTGIAMTSSGTNTWTAAIPAATTPVNANVTWTLIATDGTYNVSATGTAYKDAYLTGSTMTAVVNPATICLGASQNLSAYLGSTAAAPSYPSCTATNTGDEELFNVTLGTLNNTSVCGTVATGTGSTAYLYNNYTSLNPTMLLAGQTYSGSITAGYCGTTSYNNIVVVYIDYNRNGVFTDAGENVWTSAYGTKTFPSQVLPFSITIPTNISYGYARMRVVINESSTAPSSGTFTYGEVEDYTVQLAGGLGFTYAWSDGTSTITPVSGSYTPTVAGSYSYSVNGTDPNGCSVASSPVAVTVNPLPIAPTSLGSAQCGAGIPKAKVSSTTSGVGYKWYLAQTGGAAVQSSAADSLTSYSITANTTFYVSAYDLLTNCESGRTPVYISVTQPDSIIATVSPVTACPGTPVTLTASKIGSNNNYAYSWNGTTAAGQTGSSVTINAPATAGNYTFNVSGVDGICTRVAVTNTLNIIVPPTITSASVSPSVVCQGDSATLVAQTPMIVTGNTTFGTQALTTTGTVQPFYTYYSGNRIQILYTAAELTAKGIAPGAINSIAFKIPTGTTISPVALSNFSVKIGNTALANLTTTFVTGLTEKYYNAAYTPTVGDNVFTFSTPYMWDGTSNIVIQTCYLNGSALLSNTNAVYYTATTNTSVIYYYSSTVDVCSYATGYTTTSRPDVVFNSNRNAFGAGSLSWAWLDGATTVGTGTTIKVAPQYTTTFTVKATDPATTCSSVQNVLLTVNPLPATPIATASEQCGAGIPTASVVSASGLNPTPFFWYNGATSNTVIQNPPSGGPLSTYYTNDFTLGLNGATLSGSASQTNGVVQLTPNTTSQIGGLTIPASGSNATKYQVEFDMTTTGTSGSMADGLSYSFADDASATAATPNAEHGTGTKLKLCFDSYDAANGNNGQGVWLMYNCNITPDAYLPTTAGVLAYSTNVSWLNATTHVTLKIDSIGSVTVMLGSTTLFSNVQLPASYLSDNHAAWKHVFKARTGGLSMLTSIDNVNIKESGYGSGYSTYNSPITQTTTFYVSERNASTGCYSPRVAVLAHVTQPDSVAVGLVASSANNCLGETVTLTATNTGTTNNYSYSWNGLAAAGIDSTLHGATITVTPTAAGTYTYKMTALDGACTYIVNKTYTVNPNPLVNTIATIDTLVCSGSPANMSALAVGPGNPTIGTGASSITGNTYPNPFNTYFWGNRTQFMYTAAELTAAQIYPGNMTSIALKVPLASAITALPLTGYTVKIGNTTQATTTTAFINSGLTTVYTAASYTPVVGNNVFNFSAPFYWDGTSNIVIDICFNNASYVTNTTQIYTTTTSYNSVVHTHGDNANNCTATTGTVSNIRPDVVFGAFTFSTAGNAWAWSDGSSAVGTVNPITVNPLVTTTYTATATNSFGCTASTSKTIVARQLPLAPVLTNSIQCGTGVPICSAEGGEIGQYRWYKMYPDSVPSLIMGEFGSTLVSPSSLVYGDTSFLVSINDGYCEGPKDTVSVSFITADVLNVTADYTSSVCVNTPVNLTISQVGSVQNEFDLTWLNGGFGSGMVQSVGSISGTKVVTPTNAGSYTYQVNGVEPGTGCTASGTVTISVINPNPNITAAATAYPSIVCGGGQSTLNLVYNGVQISSIGAGPQTDPVGYTNPSFSSTGDEEIFGVKLGTLNNPSTCTSVASGAGSTLSSYNNYTTSVAPPMLIPGTSYDASITIGYCLVNTYSNMARMWIDFNRDGDFLDNNELVYTKPYGASLLGGTEYPFTVAIPVDATIGITRMRVVVNESSTAPTPTQTGSWGEGEDYWVNIGTGIESFQWLNGTNYVSSTPQTSVNVTGNTTFTAQVMRNGCPIYANTTVTTDPTVMDVTLSSNGSYLCYNSVASLSGTIVGGCPPYNVVIRNDQQTQVYNGSIYLNDFSTTFAAVAASGYTVTVTDLNGQVDSSYVYIGVNNPQPEVNDLTICGTSATFVFSATPTDAGSTVKWWSAQTGGTNLATGLTYTTPLITTVGTSTYYVEETLPSGCKGARYPVNANLISAPAINAYASNDTICFGNTISLNVFSDNQGYNFSWNHNAGTGNVVSINPDSTRTYIVTATDVSTGCVATASVPVLVNPVPTGMVVTATPSASCPGSTVQLNAGGISYGPQTLPTGYCTTTWGAGGICITNVQFNTLNYSSSCLSSPYYEDVPASVATTAVIPGQSYPFTISTPPGTTYASGIVSVWFDWNRNGLFEATEWYQPYTAGTQTTITVTVPTNAVIGLTKMRVRLRGNGNTNGSGDACLSFGSGETEEYSFNILGNATSYTWSSTPAGFTSSIQNPVVNPTVETIYTATITNLFGCSSSASDTVTMLPKPVGMILGSTAICKDAQSPKVTFIATGVAPFTFKYTVDGGAVQTATASTDSSTVLASTSIAGQHVYKLISVQDANCTTIVNDSVIVTVNDLPTIAFTVPYVSQNPNSTTYELTGATPAGGTYGGDGVTGTNFNASIAGIGTHQVVYSYTDANGCSNTGYSPITVYSLSTATISGTTTVCRNSSTPSVTFNGSNGIAPYTFTYTVNGGTEQTVTSTSGSTATVSVSTTSNGVFVYKLLSVQDANATNTIIDSVTVTVTSPSVSMASIPNQCVNTENYVLVGLPVGGVFSGNGVTGMNFDASQAGVGSHTLTYTYTDTISGCSSSASTPVVVLAAPSATISGTTATCMNSTTGLTLTATGAAPFTFVFNINGGDDSTIVSGSPLTVNVPTSSVGTFVYHLTKVQDANCALQLTDSATVTVKGLATASILNNNGPICNNSNAIFTLAGTPNATVAYTLNNVAGTVTLDGGGSATIEKLAQDANQTLVLVSATINGCTQSVTGTSVVNIASNAFAAVSGTNSLCTGTGSTLTLTGSSGSIQWQKSTVAAPSWTNVTGATTTTLATGNLTTTGTPTTVSYRARLTLGTCVDTTDAFVITVSPTTAAGTVAVNDASGTAVCLGGDKAMKVTGNVGSIQWQSSTASATAGFADVTGATSTPYTFTNITLPTWYRVVVKSGACASVSGTAVAITVNQPTAAGSISGTASVVCSGSASTLTLTGSSGTIAWFKSTNWTSATPTWSTVAGTTATLATGNLTASTAFRAILSSGVCAKDTTSNFVVSVDPAAVAGTISASSSSLCTGNTGTTLTLSGYTGTSVQWQSAATATGTFANITGATGSTYNTGALSASSYYKAVVTSGVCATKATTATATTITVSQPSVAGTISGGNKTICTGTNATLTLAGNTGTIQWQSSTDGTTWSNISGATAATYSATSVTVATWYRAAVTSGACASAYTTSVKLTPLSSATAGTISGTNQICTGTSSTLTLGGYVGTITWQKATVTAGVVGTYASVTGANAETFSTGALTATTSYRAQVTIGTCSTVYTSGDYIVTVDKATVAGTAAVNEATQVLTVCAHGSKSLKLTGNTGTIQWQSSTTSATSGFTNVTGATSTPYTFADITANTWYKAVVTSGVCSSVSSNVIAITVSQPADAGTLDITAGSFNDSVCSGSASSLTLNNYSTYGTIVWQKSTDWTVTSPTWAVATGTTSTLATGNLTAGAAYRAILTSGSCKDTSNIKVIAVSAKSVVGTVAAATVCTGSGTTLTVTGYTGNKFQWQTSATAAGAYSNITGATSTSYATGNLSATSYYKLQVTSGVCPAAVSATAITVTVNPASSATIPFGVYGTATTGTNVVNICSGNAGKVTLPTGYIGTIQWQQGPTVTGPWTDVSGGTGATTATYTTTAMTATTYYRAKVTSGVCAPVYSQWVKFNVTLPNAGTISPAATYNDTVCSGSGTTLSLSGSVGTIVWQKAPVTAGVPGTFATVTGQTATSLSTGNLTATSAYRAILSVGSCTATTNAFIVTVNPAIVTKAVTGPVAGVCSGSTATLTLATGSVGTIQWQSSTDSTTWTNVGSAIAPTAATNAVNTLTSSALTVKTWFRVMLSSGVCSAVATTPFAVKVSPLAVAGTISGTSQLCVTGNTGITLTLSGSNGTIVWQKATVSTTDVVGTFAAVTGQTSTTLATGTLTAGKFAYRAILTSGVCTATTSNFIVTVNPAVVTKTITQNTTTPSGATSALALCTSGTVVKTLTLPTGYVGAIQWQRSTDNVTFTDISGATSATYTVSGASVGANYFRVKLTSGLCSVGYTNVLTIWYKACVKTVEDEVTVTEFDAIAYPNPYDQYFTLQLSTESDENVSITVYDMAGKLLENLTVQPSDLESLQIGKDLSTGVYNVMVTQGREAKVLRLMKR